MKLSFAHLIFGFPEQCPAIVIRRSSISILSLGLLYLALAREPAEDGKGERDCSEDFAANLVLGVSKDPGGIVARQAPAVGPITTPPQRLSPPRLGLS